MTQLCAEFGDEFYCPWAAEALGQPTLRCYGLRHTAASLWAPSAMPMKQVATALGHADTGVTYKRYRHIFRDALDAHIGRFEASLAAPSAPITPLQREA